MKRIVSGAFYKCIVIAACSILSMPAHAATEIALAQDGTNVEKQSTRTLDKAIQPSTVSRPSVELSLDALALAKLLGIVEPIRILKENQSRNQSSLSTDELLKTLLLRQRVTQSIQYAALELEEALANIDGDLSSTNMQFSFLSTKHERGILLNNVATFMTAGTLGVLDSATGIKLASPVPNIFGMTGNAVSVGLPLVGLRHAKYKLKAGKRAEGNMLAPILGRAYGGVAYDPIIWSYIEGVPADGGGNVTRRQQLLKSWQAYRGLKNDAQSDAYISELIGVSGAKTSLDVLKTRSEMLVDLRALVQQMYRDISELNTSVMGL